MTTFQDYKHEKSAKLEHEGRQLADHGDWFIYQSDPPHLAHHNLNCAHVDVNGQTISCRQLAHAWLLQQKRMLSSEQGKIDNPAHYPYVFARQRHLHAVDWLMHNDFDRKNVFNRASRYAIAPLRGNGIGKELRRLFETRLTTRQRLYLLIGSEIHLMAATVEQKASPERFVVNFYDPNHTIIHQRAVFKSLGALEKINLADLSIDKRKIERYFPTFKSCVICDYPNPNPNHLPKSHTSMRFVSSTPLSDLTDENIKDRYFFAVRTSHSYDAAQCISELIERGSHDLINTPVSKRHSDHTFSALHAAFNNDDTEVVTSVLQPLVSHDLPEAFVCKSIHAANSDGKSALHTACVRGNVRTVSAVIGIILASNLSDTAKIELISAKNSQGISALHAAYKADHSEVVYVINELILASSFSDNDKALLLKAEDNTGVPGLHTALSNNYAYTAAFYAQQISQSDLAKSLKIQLIECSNQHRESGRHVAHNKGNTNAVLQYTRAILASKLPDINKLLLLSTTAPNRLYALTASITQGHSKTACLALRQILLSNLPREYVTRWMDALFSGPNSPLIIAANNGHTETVESVIDVLTEYGFCHLIPENMRVSTDGFSARNAMAR